MPALSFELVLRRLESMGPIDPRPRGLPDINCASGLFANEATGPCNQESGAACGLDHHLRAYLTHTEAAPCEAVQPVSAIAELGALLEASQLTLRRIDGHRSRDPDFLHQLRVAYARAFHPDKLPRSLDRIANRLLADINARIDAAAAGCHEPEKL
ncbi:MAG: hypothetical protein KJ622_16610 [Alphaproteobacteria bacterium]|nr:hypothetical protein [Alphaproteobacteria bacterium]